MFQLKHKGCKMEIKRLQQLAGVQLNEELDVTIEDSLEALIQYMKELQQELKAESDEEIRDQIEQDIHELGGIIERKKGRS